EAATQRPEKCRMQQHDDGQRPTSGRVPAVQRWKSIDRRCSHRCFLPIVSKSFFGAQPQSALPWRNVEVSIFRLPADGIFSNKRCPIGLTRMFQLTGKSVYWVN